MSATKTDQPRRRGRPWAAAAVALLCAACSDDDTFSGTGSTPVEPPINVRGGNPLRLLASSELGEVVAVTIEFPKTGGSPNVGAQPLGQVGPEVQSGDGPGPPTQSAPPARASVGDPIDEISGDGSASAAPGGSSASGGGGLPVDLFGGGEIHIEDRASPTADPAAVFSIIGIEGGLFAQDEQGNLALLYSTPSAQSLGRGIRLHGSEDALAGTGSAALAFDNYAYVDENGLAVFILEDQSPAPQVSYLPPVRAQLPPGVRKIVSLGGSPATDDTFFVAYRILIGDVPNDFIARVRLDGTLVTPNVLGAAKGPALDMARWDDSLYILSLIGDDLDPVVIDFTVEGTFQSGLILDPSIPDLLGVDDLTLLVVLPDNEPLQFGVSAPGANGVAIVDSTTGGLVQTIALPEGLTVLDLGRESLPND
ncbi:MAG: hypothetical protein AAFZ65_10210 [Planctomycetota bacterium]